MSSMIKPQQVDKGFLMYQFYCNEAEFKNHNW